MKKILMFRWALVAMVIAISFTSCEKSDEGGKVEKGDALYKTWYKHAGRTAGGEHVYDEFIFNADGTFKFRIVNMSFTYRTIDGTYRIVESTTNYVENDNIEAYTMNGYRVITKFTIEFNSSEYDFEKEEIMYLERRDDSKQKAIVVTTPLFGRSGGYYHNPKVNP